MSPETHSQLANFIWSICNLLRGPYKRNEYRKVILPLTVLRRFDCLLAPTKAQGLAEHEKIKTMPEPAVRRIAIVFNGSPLFAGDAGSGESNIRQWIIEWLEAIVALPDQLFYNTGIST